MRTWFGWRRGRAHLPEGIIRLIEDRMRPGALSESGFLADGEALLDVLAHDAETLRAIAVSFDAIGSRIDAILSEALAHGGGPDRPVVPVRDNFLVYGGLVSFGSQECPFLDSRGRPCPARGSQEYAIANRLSGAHITVTGLAAHLILKHRFFEGTVPYRIDPVLAAQVLELVPALRPPNQRLQWRATLGDGSPGS